jgi:hypothetical protein
MKKSFVCFIFVGLMWHASEIQATSSQSTSSGVTVFLNPQLGRRAYNSTEDKKSPLSGEERSSRAGPKQTQTRNNRDARGGVPSSQTRSWEKFYSPQWMDSSSTRNNSDDVGITEAEDVAGYASTGLSLAGYPADFLMNRPSMFTQSIGSPNNPGAVDTFGIMVDVRNNGIGGSPRMDFSGPGTLRF